MSNSLLLSKFLYFKKWIYLKCMILGWTDLFPFYAVDTPLETRPLRHALWDTPFETCPVWVCVHVCMCTCESVCVFVCQRVWEREPIETPPPKSCSSRHVLQGMPLETCPFETRLSRHALRDTPLETRPSPLVHISSLITSQCCLQI